MPNTPRSILFVIGLSLALGCGTDNFTPAEPLEPSELYWELALNHHAVTLGAAAPYDTLTVVAAPQTATGQPMAGAPAPVYVSRDVGKVAVTPEGVLYAVTAGAEPVWVVATLTMRNVKHADSVRVRVVDVAEPPVLTTFSVQPVPPDSAKVAISFPYMPPLPVHAADEHGAPINDLMVAFRSSNPRIAQINPVAGLITGLVPGKVTFYASATAFGVAKSDSVHYRTGAPIAFLWAVEKRTPESDISPEIPTLTVGVGAVFLWVGDSTGFSLEFDAADAPNLGPALNFSEGARVGMSGLCDGFGIDCASAGNVVAAPPANRGGGRILTTPGTYDYRCPPCGTFGRIIVLDEREP